MTAAVRRIVLCGDDFGMSAGVDRGIVCLAEARRLTAVSCMAAAPRFAWSG